MKDYFGDNFKIINHYVNSDFEVLSKIFLIYNSIEEEERGDDFDPFDDYEIEPESLKRCVLDSIMEGSLDEYNEWFYKPVTKEELIDSINKDTNTYRMNYKDFEALSRIFKIGFCVYTNRYEKDQNDFSLQIIIHDDLLEETQIPPDLRMIPLYQNANLKLEESGELIKQITILKGLSIIPYELLTRNPEIKNTHYWEKILL